MNALSDQYRKALADNVRRIRKEKGLTQEELATDSGLANSRIGEIEQERGNPEFETLCKIASALDVELSDLFQMNREN